MCGECGGSVKVIVLYMAPCYWPNCVHTLGQCYSSRGEFAEGVTLGVQKRGRPTLLGSLPRYRNKAELVSAANQAANPL